MGFPDVEIRRQVAFFGRFSVYFDNVIKQVCLEAQIAGGGILASKNRFSFQVEAYRVMLVRGFSTALLSRKIGFTTRVVSYRVVSYGSCSTVRSACSQIIS